MDIVTAAFNGWVPLGLAEYPTAETGGPERIYIRAAELRALAESAYRAGWGARETAEPPRPCPDCGSLLAYSHCEGCSRAPALATESPGPGVRCPGCGALPEEQHREECPEPDDSEEDDDEPWPDPDPDGFDPGPEVDDEGGMSEYRHALPDGSPDAF